MTLQPLAISIVAGIPSSSGQLALLGALPADGLKSCTPSVSLGSWKITYLPRPNAGHIGRLVLPLRLPSVLSLSSPFCSKRPESDEWIYYLSGYRTRQQYGRLPSPSCHGEKRGLPLTSNVKIFTRHNDPHVTSALHPSIY